MIFDLTSGWLDYGSRANSQAGPGQFCAWLSLFMIGVGNAWPLGPPPWVQKDAPFALRADTALVEWRSVMRLCSFRRQQEDCSALQPLCYHLLLLSHQHWQALEGWLVSLSRSPVSCRCVCCEGRERPPVAPSPAPSTDRRAVWSGLKPPWPACCWGCCSGSALIKYRPRGIQACADQCCVLHGSLWFYLSLCISE